MIRSLGRVLLFVSFLTGVATCSTSSVTSTPPSYVAASTNFVYFESGEDLGSYLRYDSSCGPFVSAHRGGPLPGYPENAIETLKRSVRTGPVFLEVDVRLTRDEIPVLLHDETLERTTTGSGRLDEMDFHDMRSLYLRDEYGITTPFQIPTLSETLSWVRGRAILTLDVKSGVSPDMIVRMIRTHNAEGSVIIIVYSIDDYQRYQSIAPDLVYSVSFSSRSSLEAFLADGESLDNIIVWTGVGVPERDLVDLVHESNSLAMAGTFGDIDTAALEDPSVVYGRLIDLGVDVIATDLVPLASRVVNRSRRVHTGGCEWLQ